jgi:hypothetical protein
MLLRVSEELERKRAEDEARAMREKTDASFRRNAAAAALEELTSLWRELARTIQSEARPERLPEDDVSN